MMIKLFTIQPNEHYRIYTGLSSDTLQMFVAESDYELVVVYFDPAGNMLRYDELPPLEIAYEVTNSPSENDVRRQQAAHIALKNIGLIQIQPIQVAKFLIVKHMIGVRQFPGVMQRFLEDGPEYTRDEIEQLKDADRFVAFTEQDLTGYTPEEDIQDREAFENWKASGDYVLYCGNDFWCFEDGEIHSS